MPAATKLPTGPAARPATFLIRRDPLATAAVLVVACSCSIALATPIAVLASVAAAARRGLLVKGGKVLDALARADVLLLDKTGTLTLGRPQLTDVLPLDQTPATDLLALAAAAERYSEHPLARAVRAAATAQGLPLAEPDHFEALPGMGVRARLNDRLVEVGNGRLVPAAAALPLAALRRLGLTRIELLTGDNRATAAALAAQLGVAYRAGLLPEDKIAVVKEHQARGRIVVMVGDGVNDAPALAQASPWAQPAATWPSKPPTWPSWPTIGGSCRR